MKRESETADFLILAWALARRPASQSQKPNPLKRFRSPSASEWHPAEARGRVDRVLFRRQVTKHHGPLPPCPSQNRTSGFPNIRLFSLRSSSASGETDSTGARFLLMAIRPRREHH